MGERMLCKHEVIGSIPFTSTTNTGCVVLVCVGGGKVIAKQVCGRAYLALVFNRRMMPISVGASAVL